MATGQGRVGVDGSQSKHIGSRASCWWTCTWWTCTSTCIRLVGELPPDSGRPMDTTLPLQNARKSRTLRVTWRLTYILAIFPILSLWAIPWLHSKAYEIPLITEPGTIGWFVTFTVGSFGCVVLLVGQILAFQNRKVALNSRIWALLAVAATLLLWGYWFYATTTKSVSAAYSSGASATRSASAAAPMGKHSVKLTWKPSVSPRVVGYNIYRSTVPGQCSEPRLNYAPIPETTFTDNMVEDDKVYFYCVKAVDGMGHESPSSNIAEADVH